MAENIIETHGLTRYFGARRVVGPLDLAVPRGSIFGFLGRNGAGKSTTIRMLMGLITPTRGTATVLGHDCRCLPPEARGRIGYLAEGHHVYEWMTVAECGRFQSGFYSTWNQKIFEGVIRHFDLAPHTRAGALSRGQRAGLCLALTLAPEPELLILDDPALGLDPVARRSLLQSMIYVTRRSDRTILFSSHLLADVERVADNIAVLDDGILRVSCPLDTFRANVRRVILHFSGEVPPAPRIPGLLQAFRTSGEMALTFANYTDETAQHLEALQPRRIEQVPLSLEDAIISYLGNRGEKSFFLDEPGNGNPPEDFGPEDRPDQIGPAPDGSAVNGPTLKDLVSNDSLGNSPAPPGENFTGPALREVTS
jgi:ABC-2 type transport system ATP-binding protein